MAYAPSLLLQARTACLGFPLLEARATFGQLSSNLANFCTAKAIAGRVHDPLIGPCSSVQLARASAASYRVMTSSSGVDLSLTKSMSLLVTMPSSLPPSAPVSVTHTLLKFLVDCGCDDAQQ